MRYSSSRDAVARGGGGGGIASYARPPSASGSPSQGLHYKKDGTLDMRYSSSRDAVAQGVDARSYARPPSDSGLSSEGLHFKKDGTLDMRYKSSKEAAARGEGGSYSRSPSSSGSSSQGLHYKKDGTLDMRYKSSRDAILSGSDSQGRLTVDRKEEAMKRRIKASGYDMSDVPVKKDGTPNMTRKAAREWVAKQAQYWDGVDYPPFLHLRKDGTPDVSSAVTRIFLEAANAKVPEPSSRAREKYWERRMLNSTFAREREEVELKRQCKLPPRDFSHMSIDAVEHAKAEAGEAMDAISINERGEISWAAHITTNVREISPEDLSTNEDRDKLGAGGFGQVFKGTYNGKDVAIKRLHLDKMNKKDKISFVNEVNALAAFSKHPSIVSILGYCLQPQPCIVMELCQYGSLHRVLHQDDDPKVEAIFSDAKHKKRIALEICSALVQLHSYGVVHGDLKSQNIMIDAKFESKLGDFGFVRLRGKTSTSASFSTVELQEGCDGVGTPAYMAPELLVPDTVASAKTDIYSLGVILNEIASEAEPYDDMFGLLRGKGVYGPALLAKEGKRPNFHKAVSRELKGLIEACWHPNPEERPSAKQVYTELFDVQFPSLAPPSLSR